MIPSRPLSFFEILHETLRIFGRTFAKSLLLNLLLLVPGVILFIWGSMNFVSAVGDGIATDPRLTNAKVTAARSLILDSMEEQSPGTLKILRDLFHAPSRTPHDTELKSADTEQTRASLSDTSTASSRADSALTDSTTLASSVTPSTNADSSFASVNTAPVSDSMRTHEFESKVSSLFSSILNAPGLWSSWLLIGIGWLFLIVFGTAANVAIIDLACREFEERATQLKSVLSATFRRNLWMGLAYLAVAILLLGVVPTIFRIPLALHPTVATAFLSFLITVGVVYLAIRVMLTLQVIVSEEMDLLQALKRSWQLTHGEMLRIIGISIGLGIGAIGAYFIILFFVAALMAGDAMEMMRYLLFADPISISKAAHDIASLIGTATAIYGIPAILLSSVQIIFNTVLYYDLRTRQDGPLSYEDQDSTLMTAPNGAIPS